MSETLKMTEAEYKQHVADYDGLCKRCGEIRYGDTEGDAENYPCEGCDENQVIGIEMAMVEGLLEIVDDDEADIASGVTDDD